MLRNTAEGSGREPWGIFRSLFSSAEIEVPALSSSRAGRCGFEAERKLTDFPLVGELPTLRLRPRFAARVLAA